MTSVREQRAALYAAALDKGRELRRCLERGWPIPSDAASTVDVLAAMVRRYTRRLDDGQGATTA